MTDTAYDRIRVVVVDDHAVMRAGVIALLTNEPTIEIVGEASDGREGVDLVERLAPDVALLDLRMPVLDGVAATTEIVALPSAARVLILTTYDTDVEIERAVEADAVGYLLKDTTGEQHADAIRGRRLVIGEATVKTHLLRVFAKLDVSDRTRAVVAWNADSLRVLRPGRTGTHRSPGMGRP
jgi:DNA-binding NarL/FixJ family response regulator